MRRALPLLGMLWFAGCSTAPVADTLDFFKPGKLDPAKAVPHGGVCGPQAPLGLPCPPGTAAPALPAVPVTPGGPRPVPVFPGPARPTSQQAPAEVPIVNTLVPGQS